MAAEVRDLAEAGKESQAREPEPVETEGVIALKPFDGADGVKIDETIPGQRIVRLYAAGEEVERRETRGSYPACPWDLGVAALFDGHRFCHESIVMIEKVTLAIGGRPRPRARRRGLPTCRPPGQGEDGHRRTLPDPHSEAGHPRPSHRGRGDEQARLVRPLT